MYWQSWARQDPEQTSIRTRSLSFLGGTFALATSCAQPQRSVLKLPWTTSLRRIRFAFMDLLFFVMPSKIPPE